eukprot:1573008-Alexandrium_andersonii.AAC.1
MGLEGSAEGHSECLRVSVEGCVAGVVEVLRALAGVGLGCAGMCGVAMVPQWCMMPWVSLA